MWRRISRVTITLLYWGLPITFTAIGVYLTHRALAYDGAPALRAYVIGMMLIFGTWGWTAVLAARRKAESNAEVERLAEVIRQVVADHEAILSVLETHDATAELLDALRPLSPDIPRRRDSDDGGASVIQLDPH